MDVKLLSDDSRNLVLAALAMRVEANALKARAKVIEDTANSLLRPVLDLEAEEGKLDVPGYGIVQLVSASGRSKFDKDLCKLALAEKGVDTTIIAFAFNKATKKGEAGDDDSVKFTPEKEK